MRALKESRGEGVKEKGTDVRKFEDKKKSQDLVSNWLLRERPKARVISRYLVLVNGRALTNVEGTEGASL